MLTTAETADRIVLEALYATLKAQNEPDHGLHILHACLRPEEPDTVLYLGKRGDSIAVALGIVPKKNMVNTVWVDPAHRRAGNASQALALALDSLFLASGQSVLVSKPNAWMAGLLRKLPERFRIEIVDGDTLIHQK